MTMYLSALLARERAGPGPSAIAPRLPSLYEPWQREPAEADSEVPGPPIGELASAPATVVPANEPRFATPVGMEVAAPAAAAAIATAIEAPVALPRSDKPFAPLPVLSAPRPTRVAPIDLPPQPAPLVARAQAKITHRPRARALTMAHDPDPAPARATRLVGSSEQSVVARTAESTLAPAAAKPAAAAPAPIVPRIRPMPEQREASPFAKAVAETVVEVTIGRIEVRAPAPPARPGPAPQRPAPMSLDEYLRRRAGGSR